MLLAFQEMLLCFRQLVNSWTIFCHFTQKGGKTFKLDTRNYSKDARLHKNESFFPQKSWGSTPQLKFMYTNTLSISNKQEDGSCCASEKMFYKLMGKVNGLKFCQRRLRFVIRRNFFIERCSSTGTGWPEKWLICHPTRYLKDE